MNKFEICRVLGLRSMQLAQEGAIETHSHNERVESMAIQELLENRIPYIIRRNQPNGYVDIPLTSLRMPEDTRRQLSEMIRHIETKDPA